MEKVLGHIRMFVIVVTVLLSACEKDTYKITGSLVNITGVSISGATVNLYTEGTTDIRYSTTSDTDGEYVLSAVEEGYYDLAAIADGYIKSKKSIHLQDNLNHNFTLYGKAGVTGNIIDAQTGLGIDSVKLAFTADSTITDISDAQMMFYTDQFGKFSVDSLPAGTFRLLIDESSYYKKIVDGLQFEEDSNYLGDFCLIKLPELGYRIILTWGVDPNDLDAHITGPDGLGGRFHVCYWNKFSPDSSVNLELDDAWQYGPETVVISEFNNGTYRYSVHNYTDQSANGGNGIYNSPAKVEIYDSEKLIEQYIAPAFDSLSGNTWKVFEINVSQGVPTINPLNYYQFAADDADIGVFKILKK
jgi:hypothetical protein